MKNILRSKIIVIACALIFQFAFSALHFVHAASWPAFRASPQRTGELVEYAMPALAPRWNFDIQGEFVSSPIVYKGAVYCGGRDGSVWAWDAETGEERWQYSTDGWVDATPCASSSTVYVPSRDGYVYAFNLQAVNEAPQLRWQTYTGSQDCSSPLLHNGKLYFISGYPENKLYCLDAQTGQILTSYTISHFGFSSPAIYNNRLYFGTNDGNFQCLDLDTGSVLWTKQTKGGIYYSCMAANSEAVYAASGGDERKLFCLNAQTGAVVWESSALDTKTSEVSSVTLSDDMVYVVSIAGNDLKLFAFPLAGTTPVSPTWSTTIGKPHMSGIISSPALADSVLYIGSGDGFLYCINAADGQYIELGTGTLTTSATGYLLSYELNPSSGIVSSPAVSNGWVYVATYDGRFFAFQADKTIAITSPDNDEVVTNAATVTAIIDYPSLSSYRVEYGAGANPSQWIELSSGTAQANNTAVAQWNASTLTDGAYRLRLSVNNDTGLKAINRLTVNNIPLPPSALTAIDTPLDAGGSISLSWTKSGDDGAGNNDIAGYKLYRGTTSAAFTLYTQLTAGASVYIDTACPVYTMYYYKVRAFDNLNESDLSNLAQAFSLLDGQGIEIGDSATVSLVNDGLITEVIVSTGTFSTKVWIGINISTAFTNVSLPSNVRGTTIVREFSIIPVNSIFAKPVTIKIPYKQNDIDAASLVEANLRIFRWNTSNGSWDLITNSSADVAGNFVQAQIQSFSFYRIMEYTPAASTDAPAPPTNLAAKDTPLDSGGSITLTWDVSNDDGNGDNDVDIYRIYRSTGSTLPFAYVTEVDSATVTYVDIAAPVYLTYFYKLVAVDTDGNTSNYSNEANAYSEADGMYMTAAAGGTLSLVINGTTTQVIIDANTLSNNAWIGIKKPSTYGLAVPPLNGTDIVREFSVTPSTTQFTKNVTIKMSYNNSDVPGMAKENLRICWWDTAKAKWRIVNTSESDTATNTVSAQIPHFSQYRLAEYISGSEGLLDKNMAYTYPNPATGNTVYFKYYLGNKADVTIDIYNIAGELIAHLVKFNNPAGIFSEIEWNISGIASGVYIYRMEASSSSGLKSIKKKMAIIH